MSVELGVLSLSGLPGRRLSRGFSRGLSALLARGYLANHETPMFIAGFCPV